MKPLFAALAVVFSLFSPRDAAFAQTEVSGCTFTQQETSSDTLHPIMSFSNWAIQCPSSTQSSSGSIETTAVVAKIIDTTNPLISFDASPSPNMALNGEHWQQETTSQFLVRTGSYLAVNANLFSECCGYASARDKIWSGLGGWAVSGGRTIWPLLKNGSNKCFPFDTSLVVLPGGNLKIVTVTDVEPAPGRVQVAVTGSHRLLKAGVVQSFPPRVADPEFFGPNARTVAGLSNDGKTLWLVVVDGADDGSSGVTLRQAAEFLLRLGAEDGVNLDGGGSSTMVRANLSQDKPYTVLNKPSDGAASCSDPVNGTRCERYVGLNFGIRLPLPTKRGGTSEGQ